MSHSTPSQVRPANMSRRGTLTLPVAGAEPSTSLANFDFEAAARSILNVYRELPTMESNAFLASYVGHGHGSLPSKDKKSYIKAAEDKLIAASEIDGRRLTPGKIAKGLHVFIHTPPGKARRSDETFKKIAGAMAGTYQPEFK